MQLVADKFYYWYNGIATFLGAWLLVVTAVTYAIPAAEPYRSQLGLSVITGVIAFTQLIYGLILFRRKARSNIWSAALLSSMLLSLNILNLIHNSGRFHSWYILLLIIQMFMGGLFGLYVTVGYGFFITIYFVLMETGNAAEAEFDLFAVGSVAASFIMGMIGYWIWRRLYTDQESQKIKQLTGQLKNKEQQAEILIQSITDGLIVITPEGKISLMNPAAAKMTEWNVEEAINIDVNLVVKMQTEDGKELPSQDNPFKLIFSQLKPINQTMRLLSRSGKQMIVSLVVSPVIISKNSGVGGAVAIVRDISIEKAEENRRAEFISTASHEMRTPVAAIEGYLALALNSKVSSIDAKARSYLEKAHSSTQHLGKLFQDLLTSAKAEDGRLVNHPIVVEMGEYLEQIADSLRFSAEKKGLLVDFIVGAGDNSVTNSVGGSRVVKPLYYVHVDPDRLREVITNLFDNAVKYTETGKITIALTGNKDVVQFYIHDTGPGIPTEDIPHLFQKFYRVDSSTTRTIGGTGLGLFICRKIVELYKGNIWVESEVGKGSTFYINLPRLSSQKASELQTDEASQLPILTGTGPA